MDEEKDQELDEELEEEFDEETDEEWEFKPIRLLWEVVRVCTLDVQVCMNALQQAQTNDPQTLPTWRRLLAKSLLTIMNTVPYRLMVHTIVRSTEGQRDAMIERLSELHGAAESGQLSGPVTDTAGLANHIRRSFELYAQLYKRDYVLNFSDEELALIDKVGILDLQTRFARSPEDLDISDDDLEVLTKGVSWLNAHWAELLQTCGQEVILHDSISYVM